MIIAPHEVREVAGARQRLPDRGGGRAATPERVRALCDRHLGVGADGVLALAPPDEPGFVARLRIFNPDGSEAELSGNGARQAMLYLRERGWTRRAHLLDPDARPARSARRSPASTAAAPTWAAPRLERRGRDRRRWRFQHIVIGNPQTAIRVAERARLEALDLAEIGPADRARAERFPNRTNVSFWTELAPDRIRARIFERGVGETQSSGTGACGAAVAHVLRGGDSPVTVELDGGELTVDVDESLHVDLEGWAVPSSQGESELAWRADDRGLGQRTGDADRRRAGARRALRPDPQLGARRSAPAGPGTTEPRRGRTRTRAAACRTVAVDDRARRPRRGARPTPTTPTCACTCSRTGSSSRTALNARRALRRARRTSPGPATARSIPPRCPRSGCASAPPASRSRSSPSTSSRA